MKRETHIIIGICLFFLCASVYLFYSGRDKSAVTEELLSSEAVSSEEGYAKNGNTETKASSSGKTKEEEEKECAVYVSGAVKSPGLYRYSGTARVQDAIDAVGGFSGDAAVDYLNLAEVLEDGEKIVVPTKKQAKKLAKKQEKDETSAVSGSDKENGDTSRVDINNATKEELMTLPGIGEAKAEMIIEYRTGHGGFQKPEDIMQISGIKEGIYNRIKNKIKT